jgi:type I restriction enzyme R subunit
MIIDSINESNFNEFGRFDDLKNTVDKTKAKEYSEALEIPTIPTFKVNIKVHNLLQNLTISSWGKL